MSMTDIVVTFPRPGTIRIQSRSLFADPAQPNCQNFLEHVFQARQISSLVISGGDSPQVDLAYNPREARLEVVVSEVISKARCCGTKPSSRS